MSGEEQQLVENRPEAQEDAKAERVTLNELEVSTEDELPKEEEPQGEVRTSVLVANAFWQLLSVAERYDCYNTRNRARLVEEGEAEEEQISARVGPPTRSASKKKAPGKGDQTPTKKKNESPTKGKETSSKGRQAQLVQGFQHMVQTLTRPRETEGLMGAGIEGMVEVQAEGEGDVPWCGENPQEDPVKGATRLKGKGSGAAIRTLATCTKSPRGQKRKEVSEEGDSTPKKNKGAVEENLGEETPTPAHRS